MQSNYRILTLLAWFIATNGFGQFFTAGEEPFFTNWQSFQTRHYEIIYPHEIQHKAFHIAHLLESTLDSVDNTMPVAAYKKMPLLLHNRMANANGFVSWAPRRMEWYTIPPPTVYNEPWLLQLAIHEQRHVSQLHKFRNKILNIILGEQATGAYVGITPLWFIEGDAVIQETILGDAGRGRTPSFNRHYRAMAQDSISYSYDKAALGSYKDFVPNYYQLGYQLSSYARVKTNEQVWSETLDALRKNPFRIKAFSKSFEKYSGLNTDQLYKHTFDSINQYWRKNISDSNTTNYNSLLKAKDDYINYKYPQPTVDSSFVYVRESLSSRATLYAHNASKPNKIKELGTRYDEPVSANNEYVVWSELIPNARWKNISYSVIKMYDIQANKINQLTKKTRYFSPAINQSNDSIAAIKYNEANEISLLIMDIGQKSVIQEIPYPYKNELLNPHWLNDSIILSLANTHQGKKFVQYSLQTDHWQYISETFPFDIVTFTTWNNYILFHGSMKSADQIYAFHPTDQQLYQLTHAAIAAEHPTVIDNYLYFNAYDANGYSITKIKLEEDKWQEQDINDYTDSKIWIESLSLQENKLDINALYESETPQYSPDNYAKLNPAHLFNIHSWYPFYYDADLSAFQPAQVYPGISLLSQNALSTMVTTVGLGYDGRQLLFRPSITYRGFLPVIEFDYSNHYSRIFFNVSSSSTVSTSLSDASDQWSLRGYIPLSTTHGGFRYSFTPGYRLIFENDVFIGDEQVSEGELKSQFYGTFTWQKRTAVRDLYPRWGQRLSFNYYPRAITHDYFPPLYNLILTNYLPGIAKHHSLRISLAYEKQDYKADRDIRYLYRQNVIPIRGKPAVNSIETKMIKSDYSMPLFYADWNIWYFLYFKRFGMNAFYDASEQKILRKPNDTEPAFEDSVFSQTTGIDLWADVHVFRFLFPMRLGGRFIYDLQTATYQTQFLFNVNIPF
ncbi:MAG: hypothetical protein GVY19_04455 [Bacteroidetes bacterium]|jgi:hypothetical protein|nr:hypothetical protein [Bacteroidota bacterium]